MYKVEVGKFQSFPFIFIWFFRVKWGRRQVVKARVCKTLIVSSNLFTDPSKKNSKRSFVFLFGESSECKINNMTRNAQEYIDRIINKGKQFTLNLKDQKLSGEMNLKEFTNLISIQVDGNEFADLN